jgi:hypothetical protein
LKDRHHLGHQLSVANTLTDGGRFLATQ